MYDYWPVIALNIFACLFKLCNLCSKSSKQKNCSWINCKSTFLKNPTKYGFPNSYNFFSCGAKTLTNIYKEASGSLAPKCTFPKDLDSWDARFNPICFWRIQIPGSMYARVLFFKEFVLFACDELVAWVDRWIRSWWSKKGWQIAMYL